MAAQLPVSPILRRDLSALALESEAESDRALKSPSPKPKFAARASSPALPQAAVHPGGPARTGSILKKSPLDGGASPALGGSPWIGQEGERSATQSPPAGLGLDGGSGVASPLSSAQSSAGPTSPLPGAWSAQVELKQPTPAPFSLSGASTPAGGSAQGSRATSPHCHFAPLPKVDPDRPGTRRNSFAQGVRSKMLSLADAQGQSIVVPNLTDEPFAIDLEDSLLPELSKLSTGPNPVRQLPSDGMERYPKTRRSSSGRSTSPSPSRRSASALSGTTSGGSTSSAPTSRSHSPAMSRHASGDALHLHYIQAAQPKKERSASQTRDASSAGEALPVLALGSHPKPAREDSNVTLRSPTSNSPSRLPTSPHVGEIGSAFNSTATAVAPVAPSKRLTSFVEPPAAELHRERSPSITNRCKPSNHDVVALDPTAGADDNDGELEEVEEEDEEDDEEDGSENDDEDGEQENDDDEDQDEEEDDDEEEDEDEEGEQMRKTAISGGVEVVHWRKEEPEDE